MAAPTPQFSGSAGRAATVQGQTGPMCAVLWEVVLGRPEWRSKRPTAIRRPLESVGTGQKGRRAASTQRVLSPQRATQSGGQERSGVHGDSRHAGRVKNARGALGPRQPFS